MTFTSSSVNGFSTMIYKWKIQHFMKEIMQTKEDAQINSPVFALNKSPKIKFHLNFVPRSSDNRSMSAIWLFIDDLGGHSQFHVAVEFWLENAHGDKYGKSKDNHTFKQVGESFGFPEYLTRSELDKLSKTFIKGEISYIGCTIIYKPMERKSSVALSFASSLPSTSSSKKTKSTVESALDSEFRKNLWALYEKGVHDCIMKVDDKQFKVSKFLFAAQSSAFEELFATSFGQISVINFTGVSSEAFGKLVQWIYLGKADGIMKSSEELYQLAVKYELHSLKEKCTTTMLSSLNADNIVPRLNLAIKFGDKKLEAAAESFLKKRIGEIPQKSAKTERKSVKVEQKSAKIERKSVKIELSDAKAKLHLRS